MSEPYVLYERKGRIAKIILNRPEKLNAISVQTLADLRAALDQLEQDDRAYVGILCAKGEKGFCAGFDFTDTRLRVETLEEKRKEILNEVGTFRKLLNLSKPVIASIYGHCIGGGTTLALASDMVVAADNVNFGNSEMTWGLNFVREMPLEPYKMPQNLCKEYLLTGKMINAQEGYRMGLFNRVVPREKLEEETMNLAKEVCQLSQLSLKMSKMMINKAYELQGLNHLLDQAIDEFVLIRLTGMTDDSRKFYQMVSEKGLKAALAYMKAKTEADMAAD